jgi:hypothetical protein
MFALTLPKTLAATALAVAALGTTSVAQAGIVPPGKHPDAAKHPDIIAVKHPDASKQPEIIAILKASPKIMGMFCRKAGGTQEPY